MDKGFSYIWEGIYDEFPEAESSTVWDSDRWVASVCGSLYVPDIVDCLKPTEISELSLVHEYPLPPVVAMLAGRRGGLPVRVLDFGGSCGSSFLSCIKSLPDENNVEFHVVEGARICEEGREKYHAYKNIYFHDRLPVLESFDVVHTAASLHYIRDWRGLLNQLLGYHPEILMLNALNAGEIKKTFVSFQNYYGVKIPVWFWNINEILEFLYSCRYRLIYKSLLDFSFLGKVQPLPMYNFPPEYRLKRKCNLMFVPE